MVQTIFGVDSFESTVRLSEDSHVDIFIGDEDEVSSIMFSHFGGRAFFERLFAVLHQTGAVAFWPESRPVVARESVRHDLPPSMIAALGQAVVVTGGGEIRIMIASNA